MKVQAPGGPLLTTQLYFPGEPGNSADSIYDPALEMDIAEGGDEMVGSFTFVVPRQP